MPKQPSSPTAHIAEFASDCPFEKFPAPVVALAKKSMLDALGVGLAGAGSDEAAILRRYVEDMAAASGVVMFGSSAPAPPPLAALVNGTAMHVDDYDDTLRSSVTEVDKGSVHPTAAILSALLALGERDSRPGKDVLTAYLMGVEATGKIADALGRRHFRAGFHGTATCVGLGAAVAGARLLGLSADRIAVALGIAASGAAGLRENFGTMTKPYHAGQAAKNGVIAADFAARGFTASTETLEAARGFFNAYGDGYDGQWIWHRLGAPWAFEEPGVWIKPFPSGMRTHPGMSVMRKLMAAHGFGAEDVEKLHVRTNEAVHHTLLHHRPATGLNGKFSMEFCLAVILRDGVAGLSAFTDATVRRADIRATIEKVEYTTFGADEARDAGYGNVTTLLDITLRDGRRLAERADVCKGSTDDPMSYSDVAEKIREACAFRGVREESAETIVEQVAQFERLDNLSTLTRAIAAAYPS